MRITQQLSQSSHKKTFRNCVDLIAVGLVVKGLRGQVVVRSGGRDGSGDRREEVSSFYPVTS